MFPAAKERLDSMDTQSVNAQAVQLSLQCAQNTLMTHARLAQMAEETSRLNQKVFKISDQFLKANQAKETAQKELKNLEVERLSLRTILG